MSPRAIIVSGSSGIGAALARHWLDQGWQVHATYRTPSPEVDALAARGVQWVECDLQSPTSIASTVQELARVAMEWDALVLAPGTTEPIGLFHTMDFRAWADSLDVNFTQQLRLVHALLPTRGLSAPQGPLVLFFAGGGTNNATSRYSAYTVSKIALIKMCELLHAELEDTRFTILGPGWVDTKIHQETLRAGSAAGANLERTRRTLESGQFTPMQQVLDCCDWVWRTPRQAVGGRNFSVAHDPWGQEPLERALTLEPDLYTLRRAGNHRRFD